MARQWAAVVAVAVVGTVVSGTASAGRLEAVPGIGRE